MLELCAAFKARAFPQARLPGGSSGLDAGPKSLGCLLPLALGGLHSPVLLVAESRGGLFALVGREVELTLLLSEQHLDVLAERDSAAVLSDDHRFVSQPRLLPSPGG